jgi:hypothetical protein
VPAARRLWHPRCAGSLVAEEETTKFPGLWMGETYQLRPGSSQVARHAI